MQEFQHFGPGHRKESGGKGLGLYIVKNFLQAHGSEVYVESNPGQGTAFFFHLESAPVAGKCPGPLLFFTSFS